MLRRRSIVILALALAGCGGATRVGGSSDEAHVLTLINPIGDIREVTVYADEVARLSKGALRIRLVPSPHQGRSTSRTPRSPMSGTAGPTSGGREVGRGRAACARSTRHC